jgi:hypothetical protein
MNELVTGQEDQSDLYSISHAWPDMTRLPQRLAALVSSAFSSRFLESSTESPIPLPSQIHQSKLGEHLRHMNMPG